MIAIDLKALLKPFGIWYVILSIGIWYGFVRKQKDWELVFGMELSIEHWKSSIWYVILRKNIWKSKVFGMQLYIRKLEKYWYLVCNHP